MSELALDVCQAGDAVYLTLGQAGGAVPEPGEGRSWLVLDDSLYIDVTRAPDPQKRPVIARVPAADLRRDKEGAVRVKTAVLATAGGMVPLVPKVRHLGAGDAVKGHVAGVKSGAIQGWATDQSQRQHEIPVEVRILDRTLIAMTKGKWHGDVPRAFSVPLPTDLPQRKPVLVTVQAMPDGSPFGRAPFYLTLTPLGWLLAAPLRREEDALEGEFLLAPVPNKPVSVTLKLADGQSFTAECTRKSEVQFGGRPCGFRFDDLSGHDLKSARLVVAHESLGGAGLDFAIESFILS